MLGNQPVLPSSVPSHQPSSFWVTVIKSPFLKHNWKSCLQLILQDLSLLIKLVMPIEGLTLLNKSSCKLDVVYLLKMTNILYILTTNFYFQTWHCYLVPWDENSIFLIIGMVTQCCHKLSDNFVGVAINKYNTNLQYK